MPSPFRQGRRSFSASLPPDQSQSLLGVAFGQQYQSRLPHLPGYCGEIRTAGSRQMAGQGKDYLDELGGAAPELFVWEDIVPPGLPLLLFHPYSDPPPALLPASPDPASSGPPPGPHHRSLLSSASPARPSGRLSPGATREFDAGDFRVGALRPRELHPGPGLAAGRRGRGTDLSAVAAQTTADTIYAIDKISEAAHRRVVRKPLANGRSRSRS